MNFDNKTVYVLDSYGLIFRCYFAFINRPLTNSKGQNISALFGFFRNFHYILQHYKPGYIIAAMDSKTKTFRHEMYPEYKATRNKTPEDLHAQIPWICDILKALGIPVLQCDGYEADDIIATVAAKCQAQGRTCRILSGDKDLMQLVTESCQILKPESGASTWKVTGADGVFAEWGVQPAQLLDLLSLYGDTADNIPGVNGVGVKTAAKLLNQYNDLDGIYAHIDEIKGAMQKKLADGKENAYFSQKLVRLCSEVPCSQLDEAINGPELTYNFNAAAELLQAYEATSVAKSYVELDVSANIKQTIKDHIRANHLFNTKDDDTDSRASESSARVSERNSVVSDSERRVSTPQRPDLGDSSEDSPSPEILPIRKNNTSNYRPITKLSDLEKYISDFLASSSLTIAYDCETDSLDTLNCRMIGFSLCAEKGFAVYIPVQQQTEDLFNQTDYISLKDCLSQLLRLFTNPKVTVILHNAKFDLKVFISHLGRTFTAEELQKYGAGTSPDSFLSAGASIRDTMILAWLKNPERMGKSGYSLEYLAETQLGLAGIEFNDIVQKGQTFADVPLETAYRYAAEDADFTLQLYEYLNKGVAGMCPAERVAEDCEAGCSEGETSPSLIKLEHQVLPILTKMELTGIHLDTATLHAYNKELTEGIAQAQKKIYETVGHEFNIASPKQLQTVLFEELKLPAGKKTKTGYSTDTSVLEELAALNPVPKMILEYREMAKLQSTYVETLPQLADAHGRIHTDFVQTGTATGRLSCRDPNLQNIPVRSEAGRKIRSAFTAPEGKVLISADYSQIELVVLAHLSGDQNMCKAFIDGTDVHKATAAMIFGVSPEAVTPEMRRTAKTINFGVIYGMSAFSLAKDLGISRTQAQNFIDMYFRTYSSISAFMTDVISKAEQTGYVETILGRRRPILAINSRNKIEKSAAERMAKNTPIQGSAADIVKTAMIKVSDALQKSSSPVKMLLQVHDELIFECPDDQNSIDEAIALIRDNMEHAVALNVPLRVSIEYGKNWGEFH